MALKKHLVKHGNSYALIIDKTLMELLNITPTTELEVTIPDGRTMSIQPVEASNRRERFHQIIQEVDDQFGDSLQRLAEGHKEP